jgi:cytochrome c oxidase cbb3-type subunit III
MKGGKDQITGHAEEADGIEEYDNALPSWWLGIFYITVILGVAYGVHYHFIGHRSQTGEYDASVAAAAEKWPQTIADDPMTPEAIAAGEEIFAKNCAACHAVDLTGGIGPNLIDSEWIHGGSYEEVRTTIEIGVPEKAMPTWGPILGPKRTAEVAAFVVSKTAN